MNRSEFLAKLNQALPGLKHEMRWLAEVLIYYFTNICTYNFEHGGMRDLLPKHVVRAIILVGTDPNLAAQKHKYNEFMGVETNFDLTSISLQRNFARLNLCRTIADGLANLFRKELPDIREKMLQYFFVEDALIQKWLDRFDLEVYQAGLCRQISPNASYPIGHFGSTTVEVGILGGRIHFLLKCLVGTEMIEVSFGTTTTVYTEESGFGFNWTNADFVTAISMLDEVILLWSQVFKR